jgi:hypothetical protein
MPRDIYQIGRDAVEYLNQQKKEVDKLNSVTLRSIRGKVSLDIWKNLIDNNDLDTLLVDLVVLCEGCSQPFNMETATIEGWKGIDRHYCYCGQTPDCLP